MLNIVRVMAAAAKAVEQTAMVRVDSFVRTVLSVAAGSAADLPTMPRDLSRLCSRQKSSRAPCATGGDAGNSSTPKTCDAGSLGCRRSTSGSIAQVNAWWRRRAQALAVPSASEI